MGLLDSLLQERRKDGPKVRDLCGSGEGSQDHSQHTQGQTQPWKGPSHQTQQVCPGSDQRGRWLRSLREESSGATQDRLGEAVPEIPEEEDWLSRPRQEDERGDAGRAAGNEEEGRCLGGQGVLESSRSWNPLEF